MTVINVVMEGYLMKPHVVDVKTKCMGARPSADWQKYAVRFFRKSISALEEVFLPCSSAEGLTSAKMKLTKLNIG